MNVRKIGESSNDILNPDNLPMSEHRVEVLMDFSGTKIQAESKYCITEEEVKTMCEFLSINEV